MKKLYFIRHGQSELNAKGLYAGITETPLTEKGRNQAIETGKLIKSKGIKFDLVISSPLSRALETAQLVAQEADYPIDKIIEDERLIERDFGQLESQPWSAEHTDEYRFQKGAENDESLIKRSREILDWLESQPADNILVVGHGASGRALRSLVHVDFPLSHPHRLGNAELHEWL